MYRHASVNRIYRLVWSHASNSWVPAAETTRGRGKGSCKTLIAAALSLVAGLTEAGPLGGQVVSGSGHIGQSGALTTITQNSQVLSLSWASFNIAPQETVDFVQPSASAIAVNRITGSNGTQILGHLDANGQVYLINPNGIVFGRGAQVDVGGLVASTLDLNDASLAGEARTFGGPGSVSGSGRIVNDGAITATGDGAGGGYVALLGNHVVNRGTISAQLGTVALGAGSAATLTFQGDSLVHLQVDRSVLNNVAANGGLIRADGGQVLMSAGAADSLLASVVNNTGVIEARTVEEHEGTIALLGGMAAGTVNVAGTLDASAPAGGNGGFIETSAAHVGVANSAKITTAAAAGLTGSWLIDPKDFTVAADGGDITGAALSTELATTNETLRSSAGATAGSGNININDPVSWSADTSLTLIASNNVNVNASITATGNHAGVVLNPNTGNGSEAASGTGTLTFNNGAAINLAGTSTTVSVAGVSYIVLNTLGAAGDATTAPTTPSLQGIAATANLSKNYALGSNIDATATATWNAGAGFTPIGSYSNVFQGSFTGLGHTISNLFINLPNTAYVGLFGVAGQNNHTIQNVGLVGGSVAGYAIVGELVGSSRDSVNNSYATGTVTGDQVVGGLVGSLNFGSISNSYATGNVTGSANVGGLVGAMDPLNLGTLNNSYATGNVTGGHSVGGLAGFLGQGAVNNSFATGTVSGNVTGATNVGGLVGYVTYGGINNSYATGNVSVPSGGINVGGLVGGFYGGSYGSFAISNSHATGSVSVGSGGISVGGLVGSLGGANYGSVATISNSYATGNVSVGTGGSNVGGLVGASTAGSYGSSCAISNTYATGAVSVASGATNVGGLLGANYGGAITHSYWNTTISGQPTSAQSDGSHSGVGGLTTLQMQTASNFAGFNFSTAPGVGGNSWVMVDEDGGFNNAAGYVSGQHFDSVPGATFPMLTSEYSTVIVNAHQLQLMVLAPSASYTLAANIDASATALGGAGGGDVWSTAGGFFPIGTGGGGLGYFTGSFDGLGHTISNLTMAWPAALSYVGLFGDVQPGSNIKNVGLINASVTAIGVNGFSQPANGTGALVGTNQGSISNSYATGVVSGNSYVGGLVGNNYGAPSNASVSNSHANVSVSGTSQVGGLVGGSSYTALISNSYATGNVSGSSLVGGLVGMNKAPIANSYATGSVVGSSTAGGLVGWNNASITNSYSSGHVSDGMGAGIVGGLVGNNYGAITNSYATGNVTGSVNVGGLVGANSGSIANAYATGNVTGSNYVGGLVGVNMNSITNAYATGNVSGSGSVGGLVGYNHSGISNTYATGNVTGSANVGGLVGTNAGDVNNSYAEGSVSGSSSLGGLVGNNYGSVESSFWNSDVIANGVGADGGDSGTFTGGGGLTGGEMHAMSNFAGAGWSISNSGDGDVWQIYEGSTAPLLSSFLTPLTVTASNDSTVFNGVGFTGNGVTYSATPNGNLLGTLSYGAAQGAVGAGSYTITPTGLYSTQQGYSITVASATLTITPLALTGSISTGSSVYGSPLSPGAVVFANLIPGYTTVSAATATVSIAGNLSSSNHLNAGSYIGSESVGGTLSGADASDYTFAGATGGAYTVTPLALTGSIATGTSVYGAALTPGALSFSNAIGGDGVTAGTVTVTTTNHTSSSGHFTAGTHPGSESVGGTLSGADAGNYTFSGATGGYTVTPLALTGSIATGSSIYGSALTPGAATFSNAIANDVLGTATVSINTTGLISTSGNLTAGSHSGVESVTALSGIDGANYTFASLTGSYAVTPLSLTGSIATGSSIYGSALTPGALSFNNLVGSDAVTAGTVTVTTTNQTSSSGHFTAGTHTASESVGSALSGADASDYIFAGATGDYTVTPLTLTGSIATGSSIYGSTLTPGAVSFDNPVGGDVVTAGTVTVTTTNHTSSSGHFTAGTHTGSESVGSTLSGTDAGDYTFAGATGDYTVTPLALTGTIATGTSVYGSTLTPGAVSFSNAINGDTVTAGTATVNTSNQTSNSGHLTAGSHVGSESVGSTLSGADATNYTFASATGDYIVTPLALMGSIATGGSIYGSALTPGAVSFSNLLGGDAVSSGTVTVTTTNHTSTSGHFTAGTHTGSESVGGTLGGADAGDYTFAGATGDYTVTPLALTGSIATGTSVYGSTLTPGAVSFSNAINGDAVSTGTVTVTTTNHTSSSGHFTAGTHSGSESVGTALSGDDSSNYTFLGATGDYIVTPLALTGSITAGTSVYGSTLTPGSASFTNLVVGDIVTPASVVVNTAGNLSTSNHLKAGTYAGSESVSALGGADGADYTFANLIGDYSVSKLAISITATGANKIYDGTTSDAPTLSGSGVIVGDQVTFADTAANFAGKNIGSAQAVTVSGISMGGADAADYVLNSTTAMAAATISPASLTVSGVAANNKTYDGTTAAILVGGSLVGVIPGDATLVTLTEAGNFASKNVGTGIAVSAAETLSGAGAGNYVLVQPTGLVASITPATLTYDATPASRTAGQSLTGLSGSVSGFVANETQSVDTAGTLAWTTPANAGSRPGQYAIDGGGLTAANYVFVQASSNATALTLQPATVPPPPPVAPVTSGPLPLGALSAIAELQAMMLPPESPEVLDQPAILIAARGADGGSLGVSGTANVDIVDRTRDSNQPSWGEYPVADTKRLIGTSGVSLQIVGGGVRLPE